MSDSDNDSHHHEPVDPAELAPGAWVAADDEPKRWLDDPANIKRFIRWFFISAGLLALADGVFLFHHKHVHFGFEKFPFFYCLYGLCACVILVIAAKGLRKLLMRDEDYYEK